jgi:tetratricopeptide (TPR) repeat protein
MLAYDSDEMIQQASDRLEQNSRDVRALLQRGDAWLGQANFEAALADYGRALTLALNTSSLQGPARDQLLGILYTQHSRALFGLGQTDSAQESIGQALRFQPDYPEALLQQARLLRAGGQLSQALDALDRAVELAPEQASAYRARAVVLWERGDHAAALADHNQAMELEPDSASAWATRAKFYFELGEHKQAKKDFLRAVKLDKTLPEPYPFLAYFARIEGKPEGAEDIIQAGLHYHPDNTDLHYQAGYLYLSQARYADAADAMSRYLEQNPHNPKALAVRAQAFFHLEKLENALQDFDQAVQAAPDDPEILYNRALAYVHHKQLKPALLDIERVLELQPDHPEAHKLRGQILAKGGMPLFANTQQQHPNRYQRLVEALVTVTQVAQKYYGAGRVGGHVRWKAALVPMKFTQNGQTNEFIGVRLDMLMPLATVIDILAGHHYEIKCVVGKDPVPGFLANQQRGLVNPKNITLETTASFDPNALRVVLEEAISDGQFVDPDGFKPMG